MGIYFNPENEGFLHDIQSIIYIDKTEMLNHLNSFLSTRERFVARRFGKSQAARMIDAYYDKESKKHECVIEHADQINNNA